MKANAKSLEVLLKRGCGSEEIAAEFEVKVEELEDLIRKAFNNASANAYIRRISKNDKRVKSRKKNEEEVESQETSIDETEITLDTDASSAEGESQEESEEISLDDLKKTEYDQRLKTAEQEVAVKKTIQDYRTILTTVTNQIATVLELKNRIAEIKKSADKLETDALEILEKHDIELAKLHEEQEKLRDIQVEISKRSVVSIWVYLDGTINVDGPMTEEKIFANWKNVKAELEDKYEDLIENLTLKQIRQLAKIVSMPDPTPYHYELSIETEEVEKVYNIILERRKVE